MNLKLFLSAGFVTLILSACGGGGSDSPASTSGATTSSGSSIPSSSTPTGNSALASDEGMYAGTLSDGTKQVRVLILENGQTWLALGTPTATGAFIPDRAATGQASFAAGSVTVPLSPSGMLTGTDDGTVISATVTPTDGGGTPFSFTASKALVTGYNYNQSATVASIAGGWTINTGSLAGSSLAIDSSGQLTLNESNQSGTCTANVLFAPRASGKNIFNVTGTQGGTTCPAANVTGIGLTYMDAANRQRLVALIALPAGAAGPFLDIEMSR